jgi:hypothetical protein
MVQSRSASPLVQCKHNSETGRAEKRRVRKSFNPVEPRPRSDLGRSTLLAENKHGQYVRTSSGQMRSGKVLGEKNGVKPILNQVQLGL